MHDDNDPPFDFSRDPAPETGNVERPVPDEGDPELQVRVLEAMKTVRDPEIPVNLVDLGLIYDLVVNRDGTVFIEMTLTTPSCPAAGALPGEMKAAVENVEGVKEARVKVVWEPTWTQDRMTEEAKLELGLI